MGEKGRRLSNAIYTATISWNAERAIQFEPGACRIFSSYVVTTRVLAYRSRARTHRASFRRISRPSERGDEVSRSRAREFYCSVVSEAVQIRLKRPGGFGRPQGYFVQCNQADCQYVDENKPPCPLNAAMFADEIKAAEEARAQRSE